MDGKEDELVVLGRGLSHLLVMESPTDGNSFFPMKHVGEGRNCRICLLGLVDGGTPAAVQASDIGPSSYSCSLFRMMIRIILIQLLLGIHRTEKLCLATEVMLG